MRPREKDRVDSDVETRASSITHFLCILPNKHNVINIMAECDILQVSSFYYVRRMI